MKFFSGLGKENKFVLYAKLGEKYKTNYSTQPRKSFKIFTYSLNQNIKEVDLRKYRKILIKITNYVNICKLINIPKRSRKFFAMQGKRVLNSAAFA